MCSNRAVVDRLECCIDDLVECFENFVQKSLMLIFLGIGIIVGLLCYLLKMVLERNPVNDAVVVSEKPIHSRNKSNYLISHRKVEQEFNENMLNKLKEKPDMKKDGIDNIITRVNITTPDKNITHENNITHNNKITLNNDIDKDKTTAAQQQNSIINTSNTPMSENVAGNYLSDVGILSCSKYGCCSGSSTHVPSRVPILSLPPTSSKHKLIPCLRKRSSNRSTLQSLQCYSQMKPGSCSSACCPDESKKNKDLDIPTLK